MRVASRSMLLLAASVLVAHTSVARAQRGAPPAPAPAPPSGPTPAQIAAQADSIRSAEASQVITRCQVRDGVDPPNSRVRCWEAARMAAPTDPRAVEGMLNAQRALDVAEKSASSQALSKASRDSIETFLARARTEFTRGGVDQADSWVTDVLAKDPTNEQALALRAKISQRRKVQANYDTLKVVGGIVLVFAVGVGVLAKKLFAKRAVEKSSPAAVATQRKIALKIVDGVGRGRMYTVESEVFRIGAAESEKKEEKNDLILSDSLGLVSRFHCALLRRDKKWILVDSSLNGTLLNDKPVARGEPQSIRDGDEITIAGVSRLTFLTL